MHFREGSLTSRNIDLQYERPSRAAGGALGIGQGGIVRDVNLESRCDIQLQPSSKFAEFEYHSNHVDQHHRDYSFLIIARVVQTLRQLKHSIMMRLL